MKNKIFHQRQEIPKGISSSHLNIEKIQARMNKFLISVFAVLFLVALVGTEDYKQLALQVDELKGEKF